MITAAAGSGIGFATAKRCAEEGARVLLSDTHENRLAESVSSLQSKQFEAYGIPCDVTKENEVQELFNFAITKFETVDVMINNAGLGGQSDLINMADEEWQKVLDVTLNGTMRCTRAALRHMIPLQRGVVVNNASVVGWRAQKGQCHYAAAKAGVMALTTMEDVNAVAPSFGSSDPLLLEELEAQEPFGPGAQPWEIANIIVFLASDLSSYMTGECVSASSQHP